MRKAIREIDFATSLVVPLQAHNKNLSSSPRNPAKGEKALFFAIFHTYLDMPCLHHTGIRACVPLLIPTTKHMSQRNFEV